jgi:predicted ArsR family transcriptional regulator
MAELTTGVDKLIELVREKKRISVPDAAKAMGISMDTVQSWVDFLVEEHLLGIEYKFTTPYIYIHSEKRVQKIESEEAEATVTIADFRNAYYDHARKQNMPEEKLSALWSEHLRYIVEHQKQHFVMEANRRGLDEPEQKYEEYLKGVLNGTG